MRIDERRAGESCHFGRSWPFSGSFPRRYSDVFVHQNHILLNGFKRNQLSFEPVGRCASLLVEGTKLGPSAAFIFGAG